MSVITLPAGLVVHGFNWGQRDYSLNFQAGDNGAQQSRVLAPPRWTCTLSASLVLSAAEAAQWKAFLLQLRGGINQLSVHYLSRPFILGTLAGSPVVASGLPVAVGDTVLHLTTAAGATLLQGDWIGLGSGATRQLFQVVANATADGAGAMAVTVEPPSRYVQAALSAVVWQQPTALFRRVDRDAQWSANSFAEGNFTVNLIESWES